MHHHTPGAQRRHLGIAIQLLLASLLGQAIPSDAVAFALLSDPGGSTVPEVLARAGRWPPSTAPGPAIQVGVEVGFAADLGASSG
jgi:hypothetical protein